MLSGLFPQLIIKSQPSWLSFLIKDFSIKLNPYKPDEQYAMFFLGNLVSGGVAGAMALSITYPFFVANQLLATDLGPQK